MNKKDNDIVKLILGFFGKFFGGLLLTCVLGGGLAFLVFFFFYTGIQAASTRNSLIISVWGGCWLTIFILYIITIIRYLWFGAPMTRKQKKSNNGKYKTKKEVLNNSAEPFSYPSGQPSYPEAVSPSYSSYPTYIGQGEYEFISNRNGEIYERNYQSYSRY